MPERFAGVKCQAKCMSCGTWFVCHNQYDTPGQFYSAITGNFVEEFCPFCGKSTPIAMGNARFSETSPIDNADTIEKRVL